MNPTPNTTNVLRLAACTAVLAALPLCGCGHGSTGTHVTSSGDPEADRRAEMRVGSEGDQTDDKKDSKDKGGDRPRTLYERLGGDRGIEAIVNEMTDRVIADPRVNFERNDVKKSWIGTKVQAWDKTPQNVQNFKQHMFEFLALAAGGPSQYTGRDMNQVHQGMRITNNEFDAMVGDIKTSMDRLGYAAREKRDLLAIIETTRKEVVEKK